MKPCTPEIADCIWKENRNEELYVSNEDHVNPAIKGTEDYTSVTRRWFLQAAVVELKR